MFLPMTALLTVANLTSARVAARSGHHVPVRAGLLVSALGMLALAFAHASFWLLCCWSRWAPGSGSRCRR